MLRKKAVAIAVSLLMPSVASALGLGALEASSSLNEPFNGRIEILGATAADYDTLSVKLADPQAFDRAGVLREAVLLSLKFELVETPAGNDYIRISTRDAVREPFLNFLIELNWANGRMVREYTVLLDPPLYDPNRRAPAPAAPAPTAVAPVTPAARPAPAPVAAAPAVGGGTVTAGPADTAWGLASRHRPDAGVSVQRMMVALLRANPEAFINGNLNLLRRGAVLRLPDGADLDALSQAEAVAEVARQHQLWEEYRQGATAAVPAQPLGAPVAAPESESGEADETAAEDLFEEALAEESAGDEGKLELVAPETASGAAASAEPGVAEEGADAGALVEEDLSAKSQENAELKAKLDEASEIIDLLQRQVELKDTELASLQARLVELGVASEATAPAATGTETAPVEAPPAEAEPAAAEPAAPAVQAPPAAETPAPAPAETPAPAKPAAPPPPAEPVAGPLDSLLPPHLRDAVPGGAMTVFGVAGSLLLLAIAAIARRFGRGRGKAITATAPAAVAAPAAAAAVATTPEAELPIVETAPAAPAEPVDLFARTLEASAEQLAPDPLEEVNVYLAYERFDQAEELVKKVIQQYPNEHKYKLRLLEIYYSANNRPAYEQYARTLLDAVGEQHPLWENALAMWNEMSPGRALFAPAAAEETAPVAPASKEFVDITGEAEGKAAPAGTISLAPVDESALAATAVGLTNEPVASEAAVDFDLGSPVDLDLGAAADLEFEPLLDVTGGEGEGSDVIDLTATLGTEAEGGFVDLEGSASEPDSTLGEIFDISAEAGPDVGETLKLDSESFAAAAASSQRDLLDIASTEDIEFDAESAQQLSDTVESLGAAAAPGAADAAETLAATALDFDISDTVAPAAGVDEGPSLTEVGEEALAATGMPAAAESEPLDFDIEGLTLDFEPTVADTTAGPATASAAPALDDLDLSLELDAGTGPDLALENPQPAAGERTASIGETTGLQDSEFDFDLALQDTTDFDQLGIDDTLELPGSAGARDGTTDTGESIEDLTRSMEASLAGLDLGDDRTDDALHELDSIGTDAMDELDFSVGDVGGDTTGVQPVDFGVDDLALERTGIRLGAGEGMASLAHEGDEVDTKLNLAKAYLELGDSDGARAILDEVSREGSDAQQQEARQLLSQLV